MPEVKKEDYLCLSAILRAREVYALNGEKAERMLTSSWEEATHLLTECGYADFSALSEKEIDAALGEHLENAYAELENLLPERRILTVFRLRYDYHNVKTLLKAEAMHASSGSMLSRCGTVDAQKLKEAYREENWCVLPDHLVEALQKGKEMLARTDNPQTLDFMLDRMCFAEMLRLAGESESAFLTDYLRLQIDCLNCKSAVRTRRMHKSADLLRDALLDGGTVDKERFIVSNAQEMSDLCLKTSLAPLAESCAAALSGGTMTAFELACDNLQNAYLQKAKSVAYGEEPVVVYLCSLEKEITAVRMILTGKRAGVSPEVLRERMRDFYA